MRISFTYEVDDTNLIFLGLELSVDSDHSFFSKTHFKPMAGNSYLHTESNHHPRWIHNVPYGQFYRLRLKKIDFEKQSLVLKNTFFEASLIK